MKKSKYTKKEYIKRLTTGLEHRSDWVEKIAKRVNAMPLKQVKSEMTILYGKEE